jgi:hypothetical protein
MDLYEQVLVKRIYNLEKRMKWAANDLWFLKETHKRLYPNKQLPRKRIEQLDMFAG